MKIWLHSNSAAYFVCRTIILYRRRRRVAVFIECHCVQFIVVFLPLYICVFWWFMLFHPSILTLSIDAGHSQSVSLSNGSNHFLLFC